ncbi:hypothetical protein ElyMa_005890100 [Elysia marginata]|uniref:Uncharacterized protein n=1 Tax=Elysia marginata TaxID=1093978 RepID=A0AAV4G301_9GAST|nr:hypothetical protein ElyMa_005890100 [Elysia marginata]
MDRQAQRKTLERQEFGVVSWLWIDRLRERHYRAKSLGWSLGFGSRGSEKDVREPRVWGGLLALDRLLRERRSRAKIIAVKLAEVEFVLGFTAHLSLIAGKRGALFSVMETKNRTVVIWTVLALVNIDLNLRGLATHRQRTTARNTDKKAE